MKGIILAGGFGNRLKPLTEITNKHLLPVYNKPMIFYPLETLLSAGIKEVLVVIGPEYAGGFYSLLGNGSRFGCNITYKCQEDALGIAHALNLASDFVGRDTMAVILGDNIYEENLASEISSFKNGAKIFLRETEDARRFGVAEIDKRNNRVISIEEKPAVPKSNYAVTGLYLYDNQVFDYISQLRPSDRGELEITDVNNKYIQTGQLAAALLKGDWTDAGTFESLHHANNVARNKHFKGDEVLREPRKIRQEHVRNVDREDVKN
ncbi:NTP transferase domain-containing protein [Patescibacteria group bacterium]|nr:NTP transferase domain-containing protein [Patescibacteria group bacterium]